MRKKKKKGRSCRCKFMFLFTGKPAILSSNGLLSSVSLCAYACPSFCVIAVLVTTMGESDWFQQWLHSFWPRLQAPGGRETVNKPQLAASPGVTQQPGRLLLFFFFSFSSPIWSQDSRRAKAQNRFYARQRSWSMCLCEHAERLTSKRLCKWCCGPRGSMAAPSPEPICSTSIWTLLSSRMPLVLAKFWRCCRNATRPVRIKKNCYNSSKRITFASTSEWQMLSPFFTEAVSILADVWPQSTFHRPDWQSPGCTSLVCLHVTVSRVCVSVCAQLQAALIRPIQRWWAVAVNDRTWLTVMVGVI